MDDDSNVAYVNGTPRRLGKQTSPGFSGALKDAAQAIMNPSAGGVGSSGRQKQATVDQATDEAVTGRMKQAQSSDRDNNYSY